MMTAHTHWGKRPEAEAARSTAAGGGEGTKVAGSPASARGRRAGSRR